MANKHRLKAVPYFEDEKTGKFYASTDLTEQGHPSSGGPGRAACSCGWFSEPEDTRQARRDAHEKHRFAQELPRISREEAERKTRFNVIRSLAKRVIDEEESESAVSYREDIKGVSHAEANLFYVIRPEDLVELINHYVKPRGKRG